MRQSYTIEIAGVTRHLPLCAINENLRIAAFIMLGDVELTIAAARELIKKLPEHDIIITPEAKGIPLAQEIARQMGVNRFIVARKAAKLYMVDPISVEVQSISTDKKQTLFVDDADVQLMKNKKVLILDDVISTGESLKAVELLVQKAGGVVAAKAAVLAEGDAIGRDDIIYLEPLPLF